MRGSKTALVGSVAVLALLGACNKNKAPAGQVVATVNGDDITAHELNGELQQLRVPPDAPKKQVEQVALQRLIERKMLAGEARKRGLDKSPQFLLNQRRVDETLLVETLQQDIVRRVPKTTREAAQKFMEENPQLFSDRKIFSIDQIQFLRPSNIATLPLQAAKTMAEVAAVLTSNKIDFRRATTTVDILQVNPQLADILTKAAAKGGDEPFLLADQPQGAPAPVLIVSHIVNARVEPFVGEKAIAAAQQLLQRMNTQKALQESLKKFTDETKPNIKYAANYAPPAKPAAVPAASAVPAPAKPAPAPAP